MKKLNLNNVHDCVSFLEEHWDYDVEFLADNKIEVLSSDGEIAFELNCKNEDEQFSELYNLCTELWDCLVANDLSEEVINEVTNF